MPNLIKIIDSGKGTAIQVEWRHLYSTSAFDSYDFKITAPSGIQTVKNVHVATNPTELLQDSGLVVSVGCP